MGEFIVIRSDEELHHSGTKGMKWYHRRYQNKDGSLTPEGRIRYGVGQGRNASNFDTAFGQAHRFIAGEKAASSAREAKALDREKRIGAKQSRRAAKAETRAKVQEMKERHAAARAEKNAERAEKAKAVGNALGEQSIKTKNGKISPAEKIGRDAANVTRNAMKLTGDINDIRSSKQRQAQAQQIQKMSNKELQDHITRMRLEQQYAQLNQPQVSVGQQRVEKALSMTLTALEIGTSVAAIAGTAYTIHQGLKKPKS